MPDSPASLALLSGKGGSGKTAIALTMCRILAEAELRVLLVDCDMSTHGATYFLEAELGESLVRPLSLMQLAENRVHESNPAEDLIFKSTAGFWFLPSTLDPAATAWLNVDSSEWIEAVSNAVEQIAARFEIVVYDCQAGYTKFAESIVNLAHRHLIVLEPDAVSSAAVRVLFLQLPRSLTARRTFQVFNKLTEDERPIYEKVRSSTLFPSLPPIPFDWEVRAAFATVQIPGLASQPSAFSLGVLRLLRHLFPTYSFVLEEIEDRNLGAWYSDLRSKLQRLHDQRYIIQSEVMDLQRIARVNRARAVALLGVSVGVVVAVFSVLSTTDSEFPALKRIIEVIGRGNIPAFIALAIGIAVTTIALLWYRSTLQDVRVERETSLMQESVAKLEQEMIRYETLIATDPALREYQRRLTKQTTGPGSRAVIRTSERSTSDSTQEE